MNDKLSEEDFRKTTYSVAKSLHHINLAVEYMHDVKRSSTKTMKYIFSGYIDKLNFVLNSIKDRLTKEGRDVFNRELSDSFTLEAINDKLVILDEAQRAEVENYIDKLLNQTQ